MRACQEKILKPTRILKREGYLMEKKARFKIDGPAGTIADIDVLDPKITGFPREEVKAVIFIPYFTGSPYLERGVAWHLEHPIYGSGSFRVEKDDGTAVIVSPIFFSDKNIFKTHFSGLEHWNIEFWWYKEGESHKLVDKIPGSNIHQLGKTGYLEVIASGTGFPTFKYHIDWKS
jgi:hypothetical protein